MKKTLVIILSIVLCIALAGAAVAVGGEGKIFNKEDVVSESDLETTDTEGKEEEKTVGTTNSSKKGETVEAEALTAEDKQLKTEIEKISNTNVDFRVKKEQKFLDNNYTLTYKEINTQFTDKGEEKLNYIGKTKEGYDVKCTYNLKDGKLFTARWELPKTEKQADSISIEEAEKLARKYASEYCDLNVYSLSYTKERTNEFAFVFTKFIDGYETADQVDVKVDFHGALIYLRNNTGVLDEFKIESINENELLEKLKTKLGQDMEYTIDDQRIVVEDGKVVMEYHIRPSNSRGFVCSIPIE